MSRKCDLSTLSTAAALMRNANIGFFSFFLAAAGLPLYIHLPIFVTQKLGIGLATLSLILVGMRLLDCLQDPVIGWMVDRWPRQRSRLAALSLAGMSTGFLMLFAFAPTSNTEAWLVMALILLFSFHSLGTILFYGQSVALSSDSSRRSLMRMATFREFGMLAGIIAAAIAPLIFERFAPPGGEYAYFGVSLAIVGLIALIITPPIWRSEASSVASLSNALMKKSGAFRLLFVALLNSLPVALTSTLFLFFVEDQLNLPELAGPFLVLFFAAAGFSVPIWSKLSAVFEIRRLLAAAMSLSILSFAGTAVLPPGAALEFAVICIASGAALGADMIILPVLFAGALDRVGARAGQAFGLWMFVNKATFAAAAVLALPALSAAGFESGSENSRSAMQTLVIFYSVIPCLLKIAAVYAVLRLPNQVTDA